jgi:hypothetical protein
MSVSKALRKRYELPDWRIFGEILPLLCDSMETSCVKALPKDFFNRYGIHCQVADREPFHHHLIAIVLWEVYHAARCVNSLSLSEIGNHACGFVKSAFTCSYGNDFKGWECPSLCSRCRLARFFIFCILPSRGARAMPPLTGAGERSRAESDLVLH